MRISGSSAGSSRAAAPPRTAAVRCVTTPSSSMSRRSGGAVGLARPAAAAPDPSPLENALEAALADLTPDQRLLPAWDEATSRAKRRCVDAAEALERAAAAEAEARRGADDDRSSLHGEWELALAGSGTVVTRTPLVRALSALSRGGGDAYGLGSIRQVLSESGGGSNAADCCCCRASNEAELRLGPLLGTWRVAVRGAWRRPRRVAVGGGSKVPPGALVVDVAFDELLVGRVGGGGGGRRGHGGEAEKATATAAGEDARALRVPLPRRLQSAARRRDGGGGGEDRGGVEWATTYLGERWRVGRGVRSGNLFVFRRR